MIEPYIPDKWVWTDADFESMGWHDCRIHALTSSPETFELLLDIDYIWRWVPPAPSETIYRFWVSPATLVFENVYGLELISDRLAFEIDAIERSQARPARNGAHTGRAEEWRWEIGCYDGGMNFRSAGYRQYIRTAPVLSDALALDLGVRAGICFHKGKTGQHPLALLGRISQAPYSGG